MVPHTYRDASEDPAAYEADQIDRQGVTVAFAYEHLVDEPMYLWNVRAWESGMDPWISVSGLDREVGDGKFIVEYGSTGEKVVEGPFRVFAQRSSLRKLGLPEGEPGGYRPPGP